MNILSLKNLSVKRLPEAINDKSNKWIIRFKQQNGKFTKARRRIRKESSTYNVSTWDTSNYYSEDFS